MEPATAVRIPVAAEALYSSGISPRAEPSIMTAVCKNTAPAAKRAGMVQMLEFRSCTRSNLRPQANGDRLSRPANRATPSPVLAVVGVASVAKMLGSPVRTTGPTLSQPESIRRCSTTSLVAARFGVGLSRAVAPDRFGW